MVSIVIPACNEQFLQKTIDNLLENALGEVEILVGLDGKHQEVRPDPRVKVMLNPTRIWMRSIINKLVDIAQGEYIMKIDAHCAVCKGFDKILTSEIEDNWIVVPSHYSLIADGWYRNDNKFHTDYWYINAPFCLPPEKRGRDLGFTPTRWRNYHSDKMIDDLMTFQGSLWLTTRKHYDNTDFRITPPNFTYEGSDLSCKTWLSGGRVIVNKNAWYAHLHKGKTYSCFVMGDSNIRREAEYCVDFFMGNKWSKAIHTTKWLIDKFSPPTWENFDWSRTSW